MGASKLGISRHYSTASFVIDGDGFLPAIGTWGIIGPFDFDVKIIRATALLNVSGSCVIDLWKGTVAEYIAGTITNGDSIVASAPLTVSGALGAEDTTLTGWNTLLQAGYVLIPELESVATATAIYASLGLRRGGTP
jgi:hypothetical protein